MQLTWCNTVRWLTCRHFFVALSKCEVSWYIVPWKQPSYLTKVILRLMQYVVCFQTLCIKVYHICTTLQRNAYSVNIWFFYTTCAVYKSDRFDFKFYYYFYSMGRDSSVGIATRYRLEGPGIESRWGPDYLHPSRPALGPTQPPIQLVPSLSRGYGGQGVALTTHPNLAPRLKKE
jgi:hypothetical protein